MLNRLVEAAADDVRVRRAEAAARIEASTQGLDIRFVVTSRASGSAEWLYDTLHCARGQAENLIKLPKSQLASPAPAAARRSPIRFASCCIPPPTS